MNDAKPIQKNRQRNKLHTSIPFTAKFLQAKNLWKMENKVFFVSLPKTATIKKTRIKKIMTKD